ncbi:MAG: hypothetical protein J0L80_01845 [Chitinophagales bacterium]|nr:hypothetical protein [Chitinophagales bacterium]
MNSTIKKQTKELAAHINDYVNAYNLKKKDEAVIFNKHKLDDGTFSPDLRDELVKRRKDFAEEWGAYGWRNKEFVTHQFEQSRRPTEEEIEQMNKQHLQTNPETQAHGQRDQKRQDFKDELKEARQVQKQGPKLR